MQLLELSVTGVTLRIIIYPQKQGSILWSRLYDPNFVLPFLDSQQNHLEPRSITTEDDTKVSESPSSNRNEIRKSTESVLATVSVGPALKKRERERETETETETETDRQTDRQRQRQRQRDRDRERARDTKRFKSLFVHEVSPH